MTTAPSALEDGYRALLEKVFAPPVGLGLLKKFWQREESRIWDAWTNAVIRRLRAAREGPDRMLYQEWLHQRERT